MVSTIDGAAARAISLTRNGVVGLSGMVQAVSTEVLDVVAPSREWKRFRHQHLADYAGSTSMHRLALIGNFHPDNSAEQDQAAADRVADLLGEQALVGYGRTTSIRTMVSSSGTTHKQLERLTDVSRMVQESVAGTIGVEPIIETNEPILIAESAHGGNPAGAYEPLHRAASEWEIYVADHSAELDVESIDQQPLGLLVVTNPNRPPSLFRGFGFHDLQNGGVVKLHNAKANLWLPVSQQRQLATPEPAAEISIDEDNVPRQRFKRGDARQLANRPKRTGRSQPVEVS